MLVCGTGTFAVFGPEGAYMPGISVESPEPVKIVVVKVNVLYRSV